jgi:hypothetical protein
VATHLRQAASLTAGSAPKFGLAPGCRALTRHILHILAQWNPKPWKTNAVDRILILLESNAYVCPRRAVEISWISLHWSRGPRNSIKLCQEVATATCPSCHRISPFWAASGRHTNSDPKAIIFNSRGEIQSCIENVGSWIIGKHGDTRPKYSLIHASTNGVVTPVFANHY